MRSTTQAVQGGRRRRQDPRSRVHESRQHLSTRARVSERFDDIVDPELQVQMRSTVLT